MKLAVFVNYQKYGQPDVNSLKYINSLLPYFDRVIVASNFKYNHPGVEWMKFDNNWYDFGYVYQALLDVDLSKVDKLGIFNNSNYIVAPIDPALIWCLESEYDYCGITDSRESLQDVPASDQYHIQSHFLIIKGRAVTMWWNQMDEFPFEEIAKIGIEPLKRMIIIKLEVGMSVILRKAYITMGAYYHCDDYLSIYKKPLNDNIFIALAQELVYKHEYPLYKKYLHPFNIHDKIDKLNDETEF